MGGGVPQFTNLTVIMSEMRANYRTIKLEWGGASNANHYFFALNKLYFKGILRCPNQT